VVHWLTESNESSTIVGTAVCTGVAGTIVGIGVGLGGLDGGTVVGGFCACARNAMMPLETTTIQKRLILLSTLLDLVVTLRTPVCRFPWPPV
jgi:hypothetical protein